MFYDEILFLNNSSTHIRFVSNYALEKISDLLQAKGMNPDIAIIRAKGVFGQESDKASLYLHNLQGFFDSEVMQRIYDFISHKALLQDPIRFNSYDHMVKMMQNVYTSALSEKELREIRHITQANNYSIALRGR